MGKKLAIFLFFVASVVIVAGLYGGLHNQISYTVAPEYFTRFKFRQFGLLDAGTPERLRAAYVGFLASWWMGAGMGLLVGLAGFVYRDPSLMLVRLFQSLFLCLAMVFTFGLMGLAYGYWQTQEIDLSAYRAWFIPANVVDRRRYLCAGYMHNAGYLGGIASVFAAWIFHLLCAYRERRALQGLAKSHHSGRR